MNIHVLTRSAWFSVARMAKKPEIFLAMGEREPVVAQGSDSEQSSVFWFIVCLFACCAHILCFRILFYTY